MSKAISFLDNQSDLQLLTDFNIQRTDLRTTDLLLLLKGKAKLTFGEESFQMSPDDIVVINKHEHYQVTSGKEEGLLFIFSISDFLLSQALEAGKVMFDCNSIKNPGKNYEHIQKIIIEIIDLYLFENERTNFLQMSKVYHLLNELSSLFLVQSTLTIEQDERIAAITKEIKERYYENITLEKMAKVAHMDTAYFSKYFKKTLGINFKDYLTQTRMQYALRDLLSSEKAITRIAVDNGFFSVNGFNKKFKDCYDMTPSEYRTENQKANPKTEKVSLEVETHYKQYKENKKTVNVSQKPVYHIEVGQRVLSPIKETWRRILNIGEAETMLSSNLQQHVSVLQKKLDFQYGRVWGLFSSKMLGSELLKYEYLDEVLDLLLELKLTPWLAINKTAGTFKESDYPVDSWQAIVADFCWHILDRYGRQQVSQWRIEIVWDAPETRKECGQYCDFYQTTYQVIKDSLPEIKIGGGNFLVTRNMDLENFLKNDFAGCCFDFYTFTLFPYSEKMIREKRNVQRITDQDFLLTQVQLIRNSVGEKPVYISEWSNTVSRNNLLNDTLYKGAFLVKNIIDIFDLVDGLGYWLGTDLAQANRRQQALLIGGNGLLNRNGLSKSAMQAMMFFNELKGLNYLGKNESQLVCSVNDEEIFVLGHQYIHPNSLYFLKDESHLEVTEIDNFFEKNEQENQIILSQIPNGKYELRIFSCTKEHGDLFSQWEKFNFTRNIRHSDLSYLEKKNTHLQTLEEVEVTQNRLVIKKLTTTNEFYLINIKKRH